MKRIIFAAALLVLLIGFNVFCLVFLSETKEKAVEKLDFIYESIENRDYEITAYQCGYFTEYWLSSQHILSLMVRHDLLDQVSSSVAKFVPLSEFEEWGLLASETAKCRIFIEEIWDSERPLLRNIF